MYTLAKNIEDMVNEIDFCPLLDRMALADAYRDQATDDDLDMTSYLTMSMDEARQYYKELLACGYKVTATRSY